jgi:hypothetical protein
VESPSRTTWGIDHLSSGQTQESQDKIPSRAAITDEK